MALLLFDIDGTLLNTHGCGREAANKSFHKYFGIEKAFNRIPMMGRTDPFIWKKACLDNNIPVSDFQKHRNEVLEDYYQFLKEMLTENSQAELCPGIKDLLAGIYEDHCLGLLTGNYQKGARIKTAYFNIDHYFPVGGFGDDHESRNQLARIAIEQAKDYYQNDFTDDIFIIGDTPFDIECAKNTSTVSVAVATGSFTYQELAECSPDHLFSSFADPDEVIRILL